MPPRRRGQSKRMTLHKKHKIEKKVREHNRKQRKDTKLHPKKLKKDLGVPNLWPFKQEVLEEIESHKKHIDDEIQRKKEARQKEIEKRRRREEQEKNERKKVRNLENSQRAYAKQFQKIVQTADVILEVLDARDPLGCRCQDLEQSILRSDPSKKIILVLNKIDLIPKDNVLSWLKYLRSEFPTVAFKASLQTQRKNISQQKGDIDTMSEEKIKYSEVCLGAETLMKVLKNYARTSSSNQAVKSSITVGIIGYPNVGKSSLINSMKRTKVCNVGATPGLTKSTQEVHLDKNIKLIDCPGIVFNPNSQQSGDLILRNCVKLEQLEDPITPVELLVKRCTPAQLQKIYDIPSFKGPEEFLNLVAKAKGKLKKGGIANLEAAARLVLSDWNTGKITFYTIPPQNVNLLETTVVTQWAKEFNLDDIVEEEKSFIISSLPDVVDTTHIQSQIDNDDKQYSIVVKDKKTAKGETSKDRTENSATDKNNLQRNKELKKLQKQNKKKATKTTEEDDDQPYDFATDFEMKDEDGDEDDDEDDEDEDEGDEEGEDEDAEESGEDGESDEDDKEEIEVDDTELLDM